MLRYAKFDMNVIQVAVWNEIQETGDRCWDLLGLMQSTGGLSPSYIIILLCKLISGKSSAWLLQHSQRLWLWSGTPCRRSISEVSQVKSHDKPWRVTSGSAVKPFASFGQRYGSTQAKQCSNGIQVAMPSSKWELHVRSDLGPFSLPSGSAMHSTCAVPKLRAQGNMAKKCTQFPKSSRKTLVWLCVIVKLGESANIKTASATETLCIFLRPGDDILIGLTLAWLVGRNHESRRRCFFFRMPQYQLQIRQCTVHACVSFTEPHGKHSHVTFHQMACVSEAFLRKKRGTQLGRCSLQRWLRKLFPFKGQVQTASH